jgi:thiol:disulfide interchange protein DsbC
MTFLHKAVPLFFAAAGLLACSANADEAAIRKSFQDKLPEAKVDKITKTDFGGLYEVVIQDQIIYTDAKGSFILQGSLVDLKSGTNVTADRKSELSRVNFDVLPLDLAFKVVKGNGTRKMAVFSDPDCPFCRRLEMSLGKITDVTIYYFLYPIDSLHPEAREKSKAIWCAPDRVKAWNDYMINGVTPIAADCENPLAKIGEFGSKYRISGTPTIFFANGRRVPGAAPTEQLEKMLSAASK